ncbi:hypothetical protein EXO80_24640 [Salmonella enterica]|nr:hypothetical protein [Salmonella enterica]ECH1725734.1 hypothetical protein [Salmonella enterica]ECT4917981.1 hypothetical protein [Salmonella enterica subsp. enterica serovar Newport]
MTNQLNKSGFTNNTGGIERGHTVVIGESGAGKTAFLSELMKGWLGQLSAQKSEQPRKLK